MSRPTRRPTSFCPPPPLSVRWTGKLRPTITGIYTFNFSFDDGCRFSLDDKLLIDKWRSGGISIDTVSVYLEAGKDYDLKAEYYDDRDYALARLQWSVPEVAKKERIDLYGEAGKAARECDMVIAVLGINKTIEREGKDRNDICLPEDQQEFIEEIYKINPNTVVILVAGSSLAINWMDENIPTIVNAWYPGEQGGRAIAEVLFGDYNPAGRLPLTYYNSLDELPPFDDYDITRGRTYQYFTGTPLYPFGYGLSYTTFQYSKPEVKDLGEEIEVSFYVKNTGKYDGDEVSQVYVKLPDVGVITPVKELKGFQRSFIRQGENKLIQIPVKKELLRYWEEESGRFVTPEGAYTIMIGSSSSDIKLSQPFLLRR